MSKLSICLVCNIQFPVTIGARGKYCSPTCAATGISITLKQKFEIEKNKKIANYLQLPTICSFCSTMLSYDKRKNKFCDSSCAAQFNNTNRIFYNSKSFKEKQRQYAKDNPKGWALDRSKCYSNGYRRKIRLKKVKLFQCLECKKEFTAYNYQKRKYCSRLCSNKNSYHINSTIVHRSIYRGYQMDSGAERLFAESCDKLKIKWHKNTSQYFKFIDNKGKERKYYPDFYLLDYDIWVEVKGNRYVRDDDNLRRAAVNKPVLLIMSNNFTKDFASFKKIIGVS